MKMRMARAPLQPTKEMIDVGAMIIRDEGDSRDEFTLAEEVYKWMIAQVHGEQE